MSPLCLIVAGEHAAATALHPAFESQGIKPYTVHDVASALVLIGQWEFDAVLLDADDQPAALPHALAELRDRSRAPIVLLWSESDEQSQLQALRGGATEVILKPISAPLIAARLQRLVHMVAARPAAANDDARGAVHVGPLRLYPRRAAAVVGERPLELTRSEFELLLLLASQPGEFVHRETIVRTLGGSGDVRRRADMHVCRLRRKLRAAGAPSLRIDTVYARGYCLSVESAPEAARVRWCA